MNNFINSVLSRTALLGLTVAGVAATVLSGCSDNVKLTPDGGRPGGGSGRPQGGIMDASDDDSGTSDAPQYARSDASFPDASPDGGADPCAQWLSTPQNSQRDLKSLVNGTTDLLKAPCVPIRTVSAGTVFRINDAADSRDVVIEHVIPDIQISVLNQDFTITVDRFYSWYYHLSKTTAGLSVGDSVNAGDVVGEDCGAAAGLRWGAGATYVHLHPDDY